MSADTVSENALGKVTTEKIILKLLQELATRVEKLKSRDEAVGSLIVGNSTQNNDVQSIEDSPSQNPPSIDRTDLNSRCTRCKDLGDKSVVNLLHMPTYLTATRP